MIARTVAQKLTDQNKWNVIVDNRPGAGGNLGVDAAAKSPADGYTLVMGQTSNLAINPTLYPKLPYDPIKDLVPVALVSSSPIVMAAPINSPFKSLRRRGGGRQGQARCADAGLFGQRHRGPPGGGTGRRTPPASSCATSPTRARPRP